MDVFLLATRWFQTGMLYKGDDEHSPQPLAFLSERYKMLFSPYTTAIHSFQRILQQEVREELRNEGFNIPRNKLKTQTGIMISKIPFDENLTVSDEYYAWIGNRILPVITKSKYEPEWTETMLKFHDESELELFVETKLGKKDWFPKSLLKLPIDMKEIEFEI